VEIIFKLSGGVIGPFFYITTTTIIPVSEIWVGSLGGLGEEQLQKSYHLQRDPI
jgi:hypothetical protein